MIANKLVLAGASAIFCFAAQGQSVYKCGNTFSQTPCGADAKQIGVAPEIPLSRELPPDIPPAGDRIAANMATCERETRASMKDPEAAKIKDIKRSGVSQQYHRGKTFAGVTYTMNVNGKNSYGGYVGERLYSCVFDSTETTYMYSKDLGPYQ